MIEKEISAAPCQIRKILDALMPDVRIYQGQVALKICDLLDEKEWPDDKLLGLFYPPDGDMYKHLRDFMDMVRNDQAFQAQCLRDHLRDLQKTEHEHVSY